MRSAGDFILPSPPKIRNQHLTTPAYNDPAAAVACAPGRSGHSRDDRWNRNEYLSVEQDRFPRQALNVGFRPFAP